MYQLFSGAQSLFSLLPRADVSPNYFQPTSEIIYIYNQRIL